MGSNLALTRFEEVLIQTLPPLNFCKPASTLTRSFTICRRSKCQMILRSEGIHCGKNARKVLMRRRNSPIKIPRYKFFQFSIIWFWTNKNQLRIYKAIKKEVYLWLSKEQILLIGISRLPIRKSNKNGGNQG